MPKSAVPRGAGNFNLRGKKTHLCSCRCCDVVDFRESYEARRVANEEIRPATTLDGHSDPYDFLADRELDIDDGLPDTRQFDDHDRGQWQLFEGNGQVGILSSDFTHDVVLYVNGDFASTEAKRAYALLIAERLNRTVPDFEYE